MDILKQFIQSLSPSITDDELEIITEKFTIKTLKKNELLQKAGQNCKYFWLVKKGCFRIFYLKEDVEMNGWFAFESTPVFDIQSFFKQTPSQYAIQAMENAEVYGIAYTDLQQLYRTIFNFQYFGLKLTEFILLKVTEMLMSFQLETPQQRYQKLLENPAYLNRIPLKDLASFLGVTPNSLSRLRSKKMISIPMNSWAADLTRNFVPLNHY